MDHIHQVPQAFAACILPGLRSLKTSVQPAADRCDATRRPCLLTVVGFAAWFLTVFCPAAYAVDCQSQNLTQMDMTICADDAVKRADHELNIVYAELLKKIDAASQARLRDTERAWVTFRDKECVFRTGGGSNQEGTIWPMLVLKCTKDLTDARVRDLRQQLKCQSWDLSCPAN